MRTTCENWGVIVTAEELLLGTLGSRFLQYVLMASEEDVSKRLHEPGFRLSAPQEAALQQLTALLVAMGAHTQAAEGRSPWFLGLDALGTPRPDGETSWATSMRQMTGGSTDFEDVQDPVLRPLAEMARDVYALFLLPVKEPLAFHPPLSRAMFQHRNRELLQSAVMSDATLSQLFPDSERASGPQGETVRSTGSAGTLQLSMFAEILLRYGWNVASLASDGPSLADLVGGVETGLRVIKGALMGEDTETPVLVGMAGILLPDEAQVKTPWGILRAVREVDLRFVPTSIRGRLTTTTPEGENVEIDYAGNVVLETRIPYRVSVQRLGVEDEWPQRLRAFDRLQEWSETTQLALLLAVNREARAKVVTSWTTIFDPLSPAPLLSYRDTRSTPSLVPHRLTAEEATNWAVWIELVRRHRVPSIAVAIRRLLIAVNERREPSDALVDAVIAWENLVGSREGEPTLRVSAALAWLLEEEPAERSACQKQIGRLYGLRSDIVHGNRSLDPREAHVRSREAIDLTVQAFAKLFHDRPELLRDCHDGAARSKTLILGG